MDVTKALSFITALLLALCAFFEEGEYKDAFGGDAFSEKRECQGFGSTTAVVVTDCASEEMPRCRQALTYFSGSGVYVHMCTGDSFLAQRGSFRILIHDGEAAEVDTTASRG